MHVSAFSKMVLSSVEAAGELVELYWQVLLQDVLFPGHITGSLAAEAAVDLILEAVNFWGINFQGVEG